MIEDKNILKRQFGISYLRPYQEITISNVLEGQRRLLCCMPTGSGKSLCFMYPIAFLRKRAVLIYPLLSLMNDQEERFRKAGIPCFVLKGGMTADERHALMNAIKNNKEAAVITNPEMLLCMMQKGELSFLANQTKLMVIDEAHTAVTWGESFRTAYLSIPEIIDKIKPDSILAFTATMDAEMEKGIIDRIFSGKRPLIVRCSPDRDNIFYHSVRSLSKIQDMIRILRPEKSRPAVIFCKSRNLTEKIARRLSCLFDIRHYHAGLEKEEKMELERWFGSSRNGVLAATSAYGLGVDKKDIRTVIHLSLPSSASDFLQESGRGGRDGKRMDSFVLYHEEEDSELSPVFKSGKCIREGLLSMMGEETGNTGCLACSRCVPDNYPRAGENEIMKWLRFHPLVTREMMIERITRVSIFCKSFSGWDKEDAEEAIDELLKEGIIKLVWKRFLIRNSHKRYVF